MTNFISTFLLILILSCVGWYYATSDVFSDEVTVYNFWCPEERVNGECLGKEELANPIKYKALVDQQTVMYWFNGSRLTKLNNCVVKDYENWSCEEGRYKTYMINGVIRGDYDHKVELFYQGPRWKWVLLDFKKKINSAI